MDQRVPAAAERRRGEPILPLSGPEPSTGPVSPSTPAARVVHPAGREGTSSGSAATRWAHGVHAGRAGRHRAMFGGLWTPDPNEGSVTEEDMVGPGRASLRRFAEALEDCVAAGRATSTDVFADAVALWLGLHGLAHQRAVAPSFPWPPDIAERVVTTLAHFTDGQGDGPRARRGEGSRQKPSNVACAE
ncbi:TetR-like C-terminal domain-containing protein [Streptomyces sp. QTS137]